MKKCEYCKKDHDGSYGSGRFCCKKCASGFSTKSKRKEINKKVSEKLKGSKPTSGSFKKGYDKRRDRKFWSEEAIQRHKLGSILGCERRKEKNKNQFEHDQLHLQFHELYEKYGKGKCRQIILKEQNYICNHCGIKEWNGKPIVLEYHHKDGDNKNNKKENVECICPNCHSQTSTFRNRKRN